MLSFVQIDMQAIESHRMLTGKTSATDFLSFSRKLDIKGIIQTQHLKREAAAYGMGVYLYI
jgi:hypothetical protein